MHVYSICVEPVPLLAEQYKGDVDFCYLLLSVVDFFNRINVIYGVVCEFCNEQTCPTMSGGPK